MPRSPTGARSTKPAVRHRFTAFLRCGGNAVCATCHVYVDEAWLPKLAPIAADEDDLLDGTATERLQNSRLSCQIKITSELDGLVLHLPDRQV